MAAVAVCSADTNNKWVTMTGQKSREKMVINIIFYDREHSRLLM